VTVGRGFDNMSVMRKCTLITNPVISGKTNGVPYVMGLDTNGSQYNILLTYLPANVTLSQIQQGQKWWIERRTTEWTLLYSVGEFNPYSYAMFNSTVGWTPNSSPLTYTQVIYDKLVKSTSSTMGSIASDPTTGQISVPVPGLYDVTASARVIASNRSNSTSGYYGSFYDTTNQGPSAINTPYVIGINNSFENNGVTIQNGSSGKPTQITFANQGTYNLQYSIQFVNSDSNSDIVNVWLRKNGTDLANSNSQYSVPGTAHGGASALIGAVNYVLTLNAGDYLQLVCAVSSTTISIQTLAANTNPGGPQTPGVILTAQEAGTPSGYNGQLGLQIAQPNVISNPNNIILNGPWSAPSTGTSSNDAIPLTQISSTLALTEGNLSFGINAAWGGNSAVNISTSDTSSTYLTVAYRGPIT